MARILIVEDDAPMRENMSRYLEKKGYYVTGTNDGDTGLQLHRKDPFDLVVVHLFLPDTDKIEMVLKLNREYNPKIITLCSDIGGRTVARRMGAHRSIDMPINVGELGNVIKELLE
ncbi:MAG: response regulator [bacterium]|nr:response regulator [bacterium]